jgi:hypothetical protein
MNRTAASRELVSDPALSNGQTTNPQPIMPQRHYRSDGEVFGSMAQSLHDGIRLLRGASQAWRSQIDQRRQELPLLCQERGKIAIQRHEHALLFGCSSKHNGIWSSVKS